MNSILENISFEMQIKIIQFITGFFYDFFWVLEFLEVVYL